MNKHGALPHDFSSRLLMISSKTWWERGNTAKKYVVRNKRGQSPPKSNDGGTSKDVRDREFSHDSLNMKKKNGYQLLSDVQLKES